MTAATDALASGRTILTAQLGQNFTIGSTPTSFTGLLGEARDAVPVGGKAMQSGGSFMRQMLVAVTETAVTSFLFKDGAIVTAANGKKLVVVGTPRSYNASYVAVMLREVK